MAGHLDSEIVIAFGFFINWVFVFTRRDAKHLYFEGVRADKLCWRGHELDDERRNGGEEGHGAQGADVAKLPRAPLPDRVNDLGQEKNVSKKEMCAYFCTEFLAWSLVSSAIICTGTVGAPQISLGNLF